MKNNMNKTSIKLEFAPGCFDNFEGTQEELDELIDAIKNKVANMNPDDLDSLPGAIEAGEYDDDNLELQLVDNTVITRNIH